MAESPSPFSFERLDPPRFPLAKQFYKQSNYHSHVGKEDEVYVFRDQRHSNRIVAAVRLVQNDQFLVLRSMVVSPSCQRKGIGALFLSELREHIGNRECWCFPFEWLNSFYSLIGFEVVEVEQAPPTIAAKFLRYVRQGRKLVLMKHSEQTM